MKVVIVTGGFDPLHSGHIEYFKAAKALGDSPDTKLIVGLNSDEWLRKKKGKEFMSWQERATIIEALECVDRVINFDDSDGTANDAIRKVKTLFEDAEFIFANGGDRTYKNIPELQEGITFMFGVGGDNKINSSSWILDEWKTQKTERDWGYWRVLDDKPESGYKVKELVIMPGKSLSDQRHFKRSEQWIVLEGVVKMETEWERREDVVHLKPEDARPYNIGAGVWHKASNPNGVPAHILEIQRGEECVEEDIERR
jgi:cytidyltransferase-like protein